MPMETYNIGRIPTSATIEPMPAISSSALFEVAQNVLQSSTDLAKFSHLSNYQSLKKLIHKSNMLILADDCLMTVVNSSIDQGFTDHFVIEGYYGLQFALSGDQQQIINDKQYFNHTGPRISIAPFLEKTTQVRVYQAGTKLTYVGVWLSPRVLRNVYGVDHADLKRLFSQTDCDGAPCVVDYPLNLQAKRLTTDIFSSPYQGKLHTVFVKAKMNELLCLTIRNLMADTEKFMRHPRTTLSARKLSSLEKIEDIINRDFAQLPTIEELAGIANMSRNNLAASFKRCYGMSISEYIQSIRLDNAKRLLDAGRHTVLQVANAVGYESQSSFTRVYKKHFGHTPSQDRAASH